ncbi:MAG TPA: SemiSWEET transporter [Dissulfurispiraceae bacterium]|nr:SemiSWEET transporter [Dissulfurispiraceae bacterium]
MRYCGITLIGLVAAMLTTTSLVPQLIKSWRMKETRDISFLMFLIMGAGLFLWMVYGFLIHNMLIVAANSISFAFVLIILFFKVKYG